MRKRPWLYRLIFVFTACTLFSWHTAGQANRHLYEQTLLQIELAAQTLPPAEVKALRFTAQDRDQPAFRALALRTKRCAEIMGSSSVYLLQKRGSSLYFGPESLPPGDPLSSVPGTIYRQPPQALLEVFSSHQSQVVGPYRDEYGNFVSAFAPLFDPTDGSLLAVVGVDIPANTWILQVVLRSLIPTLLVICLLLVSLLFVKSLKDKKQALQREAEIAEKERHLRSLIESSPNAVSLFDPEGHYLSINRNGLLTMGIQESDVLGKSFAEIWPEESRAQIATAFAAALNGERCEFVAEWTRPDGRNVIWATSLSPILEEGKPIRRIVGIATNITESKRAETKLKESEERYRAIVTSSHSAICIVDEQAHITWANEQLSKISGYPTEALLAAESFSVFMLADDLPFVMGNFAEFVAGRPYQHSYSFRFHRADGERRIAEKHMDHYCDRHGRRNLIISIIDVTDHRRMAEQLQQGLKMEAIGRLAGGVAHDFNNLLTGITGNLHLALMEFTPEDPIYELLSDVQSAADSASTLTRQLLAFSRKQMIEPRLINLNELLESSHKLLIRLINENIEMTLKMADSLAAVNVDPGQMEQILVNLVVNARDAMPGGGRLLLETGECELGEAFCELHGQITPGSYVVLTVGDTGCGMSEEVLRHIFEPFYTTKSKGRGTGLGLATTYGAVKQVNGHIDVESQLGLGTTFRIYLPAASGEAERFERRQPALDLACGTETILVVEDEPIVLNLAVKVLKRLGYKVLHAMNGAQALSLANDYQEPIDLLLTDVIMPSLNGRQLAEHLSLLHPETKVLYTSGYTENIIAKHGVIGDDIHFMAKPYTPQVLSSKIREVLAQER